MLRILFLVQLVVVFHVLQGNDVQESSDYLLAHFTTQSGLSTNELYRSAEDHQGNLWLATGDGLIKYDGYEFINYGYQHGIPRTFCFGLMIDDKERIWLHIDGHLGYLKHELYHEVALTMEVQGKSDYVCYRQLSDTTYLIKERYRNHIYIGGLTADNSKFVFLDTLCHGKDAEFRKNIIGYMNEYDVDLFEDQRFIYHRRENSDSLEVISIDNLENRKLGFQYLVSGNVIYCSYTNRVVRMSLSHPDRRAKIDLPCSEIRDIELLGDGNILITGNDGMYVIHDSITHLYIQQHLYPGVSLCGITKSGEGNHWITSNDRGLYLLRFGLNTSTYIPERTISSLSPGNEKGEVNILGSDGRLFSIDLNSSTVTNEEYVRPVTHLYPGDLVRLRAYGVYDDITYSLKNNVPAIVDSVPKAIANVEPIDVIPKSSDEFYVTSLGGVFLLRPNDPVRHEFIQLYDGSATALAVSDSRELFAATDLGLIKIADDRFEVLKLNEELIHPDNIESMFFMVSGELILVLRDGRISMLTFDVNGNPVKQIIQELELHRHHFDGLRLWNVNGSSVERYRFSTDPTSVVKLTSKLDFTDLYIQSILTVGDHLFLGTDKGVKQIHKQEFIHVLRTTPISLSVQVDTVAVNPGLESKAFFAPPDHNRIRFDFKSVVFEAENRVEYHFRISTDDQPGEWNVTKQTSQDYFNLSPGKYKFEVKSVVDGYLESRHTEFIFIIVEPHLWQTLAFQIGAFLLVLLLISGAFYLRLRAIRNREEERREVLNQLNNLKMQALQSQMNPHFIFNSLTSIQISIDNGDVEPAKDYLTKFARLLRRILESSRSGKIVLREEIELLEWYIKLETSRFNGRITYEINTENVDVDLLEIPPMIIQPYVENAIHYGLEPKQGVGHLVIGFNEEDENLVCSIQDNGVGREGAIANKSRNQYKRKSLSSEINEERLQLSHEGRSDQVEMFDLKDNENNPIGTRVVINLPVL